MSRPNLLVITTHDSGRHFGCYGRQTVHTPRIDQLAGEGVQLDQHFAAVPICCASRASMLTGMHPQRHGLLDLCFHPFNWRLNDDVLHLSQRMRHAGYRTCLFGIQHETTDIHRLAFDAHEPGVSKGSGQRADCLDIAQAAARFLKDAGPSQDAPFYAQIGFFETHTPFTFGGVEPDESKGLEIPPHLDPTDPACRQQVALLQGALRKADQAVGVILDALDDAGLRDDTLVVFTTDHGLELPRSKWTLYDPGVEIACLWRWPRGGITGGRHVTDLTSNIDFTPTVIDLLGLEPADDLDGLSLARPLRGQTGPLDRDAVFSFYEKSDARGIRTSRYKLIRHFGRAVDERKPVRYDQLLARGVANPVQLYDLQEDPIEFHDRSRDPELASIRAELDDRLFQWLEAVNDPILAGPIRQPAYDEAIADYHAWRDRQPGPKEPRTQ